MAGKMLVGIREDHYLLLKALLDLCDLGMDEFTDLITSHTDELEAFLEGLRDRRLQVDRTTNRNRLSY